MIQAEQRPDEDRSATPAEVERLTQALSHTRDMYRRALVPLQASKSRCGTGTRTRLCWFGHGVIYADHRGPKTEQDLRPQVR
jgi:hypothetical protein